MKKILSLTLAAIMLVSMVPTAFAAEPDRTFLDTPCESCGDPALCAECLECVSCQSGYCACYPAPVSYENGTQVEYVAPNESCYTITVPAKLNPEQTGTVKVECQHSSQHRLVVTADETVTLTNSLDASETAICDISFDTMEIAGKNTGLYITETAEITVGEVQDVLLFGTWSGTFYYDVELVDVDTVQLGSFFVHSNTCQFEDGMTWSEWVESDYNTVGVEVTDDGKVLYEGEALIGEAADDVIIAGMTYTHI